MVGSAGCCRVDSRLGASGCGGGVDETLDALRRRFRVPPGLAALSLSADSAQGAWMPANLLEDGVARKLAGRTGTNALHGDIILVPRNVNNRAKEASRSPDCDAKRERGIVIHLWLLKASG